MGFLILVCITTLCANAVLSAPKRDSALCLLMRSNTLCAEPKKMLARQLPTPVKQKGNVIIGYLYYDYAEHQKGKTRNRYRSQQPRKVSYEPGISYQYYDADMSITRTENLTDERNKANVKGKQHIAKHVKFPFHNHLVAEEQRI